jgi:hypothetical protein
MLNRFIAALGAANLALILPLAASAQDVPSYAQPDAPPPQYADAGQQPSYATQDQQIHGRVISFDGGYALQVRDDQGYIDNVQLHQGTVINPTGLTLASGMVVSINGFNQGSFFSANEIDTPYTFYGAVPYYGGYPWYHYGPDISFGFFFGNTGWWHGGYYGGPAYYRGGIRVYTNVGIYYGSGGGVWGGHGYIAGGYRGPVTVYHGAVGYRGPAGNPGYGGYRAPQGNPGFHGNQGQGYRVPQGGNPGYRGPQGNPGYHGAPQGGGYSHPQAVHASSGGHPSGGGDHRH